MIIDGRLAFSESANTRKEKGKGKGEEEGICCQKRAWQNYLSLVALTYCKVVFADEATSVNIL